MKEHAVRNALCGLVIAGALFLLPADGAADEYFVAPSGDDSAVGSPSEPFKTIQHGIQALSAGDTLVVTKGVYKESCRLSIKATREAPVLIRGVGAHIEATGRDGILITDSSYVTVEGLKITGAERAGVLIGSSDHITIRKCVSGDNGKWGIQSSLSRHISVEQCELYGSKKEHGIYFSTTEYPRATDNLIHDNASCGIHMNGDLSEGGDGLITGAVIARNKILRCGAVGGAAINMDGVEKATIERNVLHHNLAGGITSFKGDGLRGGSRNTIKGNAILFESGVGRYGIQLLGGSSKATVTGNIIEIDKGPAIEVDKESAKGFTASRNLYAVERGAKAFVWKGKELDFAAWRKATGEDSGSHAKMPARKPPAKPQAAPPTATQ